MTIILNTLCIFIALLNIASSLELSAIEKLQRAANVEDDIQYGFEEYKDRCTAIGVGPKAMEDGST
jgi:hypothetical protein